MIQKIISLFDYDNQFNDVWELKLIKFDCDLDHDLKPYEKYLAISHIVEDSKGNPGVRGHFYVTNLRLVWHAANDRQMNLSIGIDTIHNMFIKSQPNGAVTKFTLVVKTQSPAGSKYEFKFTIFTQKELVIFKKAIQLFKQAAATRLYRAIDTNLKINYQTRKFELLNEEQVFSSYIESKFYEDQRVFDCDIVLSNLRLIIVQQFPNRGVSYAIPWIMLESFQRSTYWDHDVIQLKVRGLLGDKQLYLRTNKHMPKLMSQFSSLASTYTKNPILGISLQITNNNANQKDLLQRRQLQELESLEEFTECSIKMKRTKSNRKEYLTENSSVQLGETMFCQQLGLMMEKLPLNSSRQTLWNVLG